jgi:ABC transporter substrate binding protein
LERNQLFREDEQLISFANTKAIVDVDGPAFHPSKTCESGSETLKLRLFVGVSDPIGSGFVENLAQPGGNLTGLMQYEEGIAGKWLAMLKEIAPHLTRIALVANPTTGPYGYFVRTAETAAAPLAITIGITRVSRCTAACVHWRSVLATWNGTLHCGSDAAASRRIRS